ncbi:MAG: type II toxin-antitoxin system VapC family toxin [Acidimicrobiia bacterium]
MTAELTYIDASAFVKLFIDERESDALDQFVTGRELSSSALLRTEARRAVRHLGQETVEHAGAALAAVTLLDITDEVLDRAGMLDPRILRTLDAIHVATALSISDNVAVVVTYDKRMQHASGAVGLRVASPS